MMNVYGVITRQLYALSWITSRGGQLLICSSAAVNFDSKKL